MRMTRVGPMLLAVRVSNAGNSTFSSLARCLSIAARKRSNCLRALLQFFCTTAALAETNRPSQARWSLPRKSRIVAIVLLFFVLFDCNRILISLFPAGCCIAGNDQNISRRPESGRHLRPTAWSLPSACIEPEFQLYNRLNTCSYDQMFRRLPYRPLSQHGDHSENNPIYPPDSGRISCLFRPYGSGNATKCRGRPGRNAANDENLLAGTAPESDGAFS